MTIRTHYCRSCGAAITWAFRATTGKAIPIDLEPVERPNGLFHLLRDEAGERRIAVAASSNPVYLSHFVTCPDAVDEFAEKLP